MTKLHPPRLFFCQNPVFFVEMNNLMEMKSLFEKAVADSNFIHVKAGNKASLRLYSLYKQATEGDIIPDGPAKICNRVEKAKHDAWASLKGKSTKDAQSEYIMLVYKLKN